MKSTKGEVEIGHRAFSEVLRLSIESEISIEKMAERVGMSKKAIYKWQTGNTPAGKALQSLHYAGADVIYILTGKRDKK